MHDESRTEPRILVVDLETTGLEATKHGIIQIGAVWLSGDVGDFSIDCHAFVGAQLDPEALRVNGATVARCLNTALIPEADAIYQFIKWLGPQPVMLAGLNPSFDRAHLHAALRRACNGRMLDKGALFPHRVLDLHGLAVSYALARGEPVPSRGYYTDEIYALLDLPAEPKPHTAINGARKEAEALRILLNLPESVAVA